MNRYLTRAAMAVLAGLAAAGAVAWSITPAAATYPNTLQIDTQTLQFTLVDPAGNGPSVGDQLVSSDRILRAGQEVGRAGVTCSIVHADATTMTCNWTMAFDLPEGQITVAGLSIGPNHPPTEPITSTLAVTGGTGRYRSAGGTAEIVDSAQTERITFHFTR
jgi:hypothetical protein